MVGGCHELVGRALFADDAPVKPLAPGTGKTATGRAWTYVRDERPWQDAAAWHRFSISRSSMDAPDDASICWLGLVHVVRCCRLSGLMMRLD